MAYTPCLKRHVHNKLIGSRKMYVGIGSLVCIIKLLTAPIGNVLMWLGCQGKGTEDFSRQRLFSNLETIIVKASLVQFQYTLSILQEYFFCTFQIRSTFEVDLI